MVAARRLNGILRGLAAAGCPLIEIHEPALVAIGPDAAGLGAIRRAHAVLTDGVDRDPPVARDHRRRGGPGRDPVHRGGAVRQPGGRPHRRTGQLAPGPRRAGHPRDRVRRRVHARRSGRRRSRGPCSGRRPTRRQATAAARRGWGWRPRRRSPTCRGRSALRRCVDSARPRAWPTCPRTSCADTWTRARSVAAARHSGQRPPTDSGPQRCHHPYTSPEQCSRVLRPSPRHPPQEVQSVGEHISLMVNGTHRELDVEPRRLLVQALREDLDLTGTHVGVRHEPVRRLYGPRGRPCREVVHDARGPGGRLGRDHDRGHGRR